METDSNTPSEKNKRGRPRKDLSANIDWLTVMDAARADKRLAVRVWYPEARGELLHLDNGIHAEVLIGNPAYQVSSGEIVAL